ncbi:MAG: TVP38/TMEM64 family protein [Candidatus Saccharibacteria bacterium]
MDRRQKIIDIILTLALTLLLVWAVLSFTGKHLVFELLRNDEGTIRDYLQDIGVWAAFAFITLVVLEVLIAFIPGWVVYPIGAALFGFWTGLGLILVGNFVGASISFWIGRRYGVPFLERFISARYIRHWEEFMKRHGSWSIFLLKINPLTSFDIWNYMAGVSPLSYGKFTVSNMLGILPLIALSVAAGEKGFKLAPWMIYVFGILTVAYVLGFLLKLSAIRRDLKRRT